MIWYRMQEINQLTWQANVYEICMDTVIYYYVLKGAKKTNFGSDNFSAFKASSAQRFFILPCESSF